MAIEDKYKWDQKYIDNPKLLKDRNPSEKLKNILPLIKGNKALEIACGSGRNSIFLAQNNFTVDAYDISWVALDTLNKKNNPNITTKQIDLEGFTPNKNNYDLVVMTNYLDRDIIPKLLEALKPNGIIIIETYMDHPSNTKPNSNPDFLLQKNELKSFVTRNFQIIEYDEFDNEPTELYRMKKQSIIIQKC